MARSFHRKQRLDALTEINVTPLIDLAFALLIIFMITTPLMEQSIRIDLPEESPSTAPPSEEVHVETVSVDRDGEYYWGDDPVTLEMLNDLLVSAAAQAEPPVIKIRGDGALPYQKIITVVDMVKKNKLRKINLDTRVGN